MKSSVYIESTILSYMAARQSRDLLVAAHQQVTWDWWRSAPDRFDLFVSEAVMAEIRLGDPEAAARRVELAEGLPVLAFNDEVTWLARMYEEELGVPGNPKTDFLHIAFSVFYEADYLLTWNCSHLANGHVMRGLMETNLRLNRFTPLMVTPEELLDTEIGGP
jgi:hypothetical protein